METSNEKSPGAAPFELMNSSAFASNRLLWHTQIAAGVNMFYFTNYYDLLPKDSSENNI